MSDAHTVDDPDSKSDRGADDPDSKSDRGADDVEPVTDRDHDGSWSANLERDQYADDPDLVVAHALDAIDHTASGTHVNLVTHRAHGHPETYLYPALDDARGDALDRPVDYEYVKQCGCGGHVTRVHRP
ncbi:CGCGG family rSAM-modified RiPP protein [Halorubellus litoreus]|uniref:CGCGG family rSAM-modified RiPP protein n=1 Tax=Halorubellus litoreus TaxID=755308 RepID=A0ABD5VJ41_9EURY